MKTNSRIIIIAKKEWTRKILKSLFIAIGHISTPLASCQEALEAITSSTDLIAIADDKISSLTLSNKKIGDSSKAKNIPVLLIATSEDKNEEDEQVSSLMTGATDFISSPISKTELKMRTSTLIQIKRTQEKITELETQLERTVITKTKELQGALDDLGKSHRETLHCLASAAEYRDDDTGKHIKRISEYCALLASAYGMSEEDQDLVRLASPMHDVGKIAIPDAILLKPGKLDSTEWEKMKKHALIGAKILDHSSSALMQSAKIIAQSHHEKWNGSGYPFGLSGKDIPVFGRICAIADVFDALTSARPYKKAFSIEKGVQIMREGVSKHFDPKIMKVFLDRIDNFIEIHDTYED